jgi:hypothetical protein
MNEDFVTISIRCPRCLGWSVDDGDFCHMCGIRLRPQTTSIKDVTNFIVKVKSDFPGIVLKAVCTHCGSWRDYRRMKLTPSGKYLCFDNVDCGVAAIRRNVIERLMILGMPNKDVEEWMKTPILSFDNRTPDQMIVEGDEDELEQRLVHLASGDIGN